MYLYAIFSYFLTYVYYRIPSAAAYYGMAGIVVVWGFEWKVILDKIPWYNKKFDFKPIQ